VTQQPNTADFEQLAMAELEAARTAETPAERKMHLDRAAIYATSAERERVRDGHAEPPSDRGRHTGSR